MESPLLGCIKYVFVKEFFPVLFPCFWNFVLLQPPSTTVYWLWSLGSLDAAAAIRTPGGRKVSHNTKPFFLIDDDSLVGNRSEGGIATNREEKNGRIWANIKEGILRNLSFYWFSWWGMQVSILGSNSITSCARVFVLRIKFACVWILDWDMPKKRPKNGPNPDMPIDHAQWANTI